MNVLITAPSLDVNKNVSGISAVVNTIISNNKTNTYIHFLEGRKDGVTGKLSRLLELGKSYWLLVHLFRRENINLVHLNLPLNPPSIIREYLAFSISKLFGKKILLHLHGGEFLLHKPHSLLLRAMIQNMYIRSDSIVCLSDGEKDSIEKAYSLKKVMVLENTVDALYGKLNRKLGGDPLLTVLFLGRLHESKGVLVILEAISMLAKKGYQNLQFVFCGVGPLLPEVLQAEQSYPHLVHYLGVVGGDMKCTILKKAQVFILPSLYGEGLPVSLLEAMAAGLVPVVTNDGSMSSVVAANETGVVIEKNNPAALAAAIELLIAHPDKVKQIAASARAAALERFSVNKYLHNLNQLYSDSVI